MYPITILLMLLIIYITYKYMKFPDPQAGELWIVNDSLCRVLLVEGGSVKFEHIVSKEVSTYNIITFKLFSLPF